MSRCFPYPPPGYTVRRSDEEAALIESIKLQKEREKALQLQKEREKALKLQKEREKAERKEEKKREKKERKKERKEKEKQNLSDSAQRDKSHKKDNSEFKDGCIEKKRSSESETLEKSNLTVEYGQPVCSQNPNNSSDSTQNSNKRKRHSSPPNVTRSHGNVIRIRLPSQKHMDCDSSSQNQQICSTSGRTDLPVQRKCETASSAGADNICSTSQQTQNAVKSVSAASRPKRVEKPMHKDALHFRNLIENWVPSSSNDLGDDDQDWLFKRRKHDNTNAAKKPIASTTMLCGSSALLLPRAQYLQDADIFALPFTIPF